MKQFLTTIAAALLLLSTASAQKEDKSKRESKPATVSQTLKSGARITISYSQPSVKGRTIGKDVEPMEGQIWRAGANEATVFETSKNIKVEGKPLPAGKYAFFILRKGNQSTLVFNKKWNTWGAYDYEKNKKQNVLQVVINEPEMQTMEFYEQLTYTISPQGLVKLGWGNYKVAFKIK
jgi:hypothetical protein